MNRSRFIIFMWFCACCVFMTQSEAAATTTNPDAAATVVVFNERDTASVMLAGYYAEKRGIPLDHLVGLSCSTEEAISRAEYDNTIAAPLRKIFRSKGWWKTEAEIENGRVRESKIRFVALMRGVPLKIAAVQNYEGDKPLTNNPPLNHNEAAVDSEMAVLGLATRQISGPIKNLYWNSEQPLNSQSIPWLLLVCRLDAAEPDTVKRMIDDSIATEKSGLWGFIYVDSQGIAEDKGWGEGDGWLRKIEADAASNGMPCVQDDLQTQFPEHYPMTRAALYFGWYSAEVEGPIKEPAFRFVPGAIAVHIHSGSGYTLRPPLRTWCAPLLARGAAATLGNVYEPYLTYTPHLDIFNDRLHRGFTFAEAAYASETVLSWMTTFIGDPLYRPFIAQQTLKEKPNGPSGEYAAFRDGAICWATEGRNKAELLLQEQAKAFKSGVVYEGLGLLQAKAGDTAAAFKSWTAAQKAYGDDADKIRCILHTISILRGQRKNGEALAMAKDAVKRFPKADATGRLSAIVLELEPPPNPSASPNANALPVVTPVPALPGHR